MGDTQVLSTEKNPKTHAAEFLAIAAFKPILTTRPLCKARLAAPHLSHIPPSFFADRDCRGALSSTVGHSGRATGPVIDRSTGGTASSPPDSVWAGPRADGAAVLHAVLRLKARPRVQGIGFWIRPGRALIVGTERIPWPIDLGNEPPLSVDGGNGSVIDRRRVSVQWFSGTILTGVCGAALMGGAVFASLDGETNFATIPERVESALRGAIGGIGEKLTRKADRLPPVERVERPAPARPHQHHRQGRRPRGGARAPVSPHLREPGADQHRICVERAAVQRAEASGAGRRRRRRDGRAGRCRARRRSLLRDARSRRDPAAHQACGRASGRRHHRPRARHRELDRRSGGNRYRSRACRREARRRRRWPTRPTARPIPTPASRPASFRRTSRCCRRPPSRQATGGNAWNERAVTVKKGENIETILKEIGAMPEEISAIASALGPRGRKNGLKEGQKLRILARHPRAGERACGRSASSSWATARSRRWSRSPTCGPIRLGRRRQHEHRGGRDRQRRRRRRQGHAALPEHLRDRAAQQHSASRSSRR